MSLGLTPAEIGKIQGGRRNVRVALDVRIKIGATEYWCDLTKQWPVTHIYLGVGEGRQDPGVARLLEDPRITLRAERESGFMATQPVTVVCRNDDSFFDHLGPVSLIDGDGNQRNLQALRRARVRLRLIDYAHEFEQPESRVSGHFFIDGIESEDDEASLRLQPILRLLQEVSPETVKQGDHWLTDVSAAEVVRRVVRRAIPDIEFDPDRMPHRIYVDVRPQSILPDLDPTDVAIGPVIDNMGRQPEQFDGELTFDESKIPTCQTKDRSDPAVVWLGATEVDGTSRIYSHNIETGDCVTLASFAAGYAIAGLEDLGFGKLLASFVALNYADNWVGPQRRVFVRLVAKVGGGTTTLVPGNAYWCFCDTFIPYMEQGSPNKVGWLGMGYSTIGPPDPAFVKEKIFVGFHQVVLAITHGNAWVALEESLDTPEQTALNFRGRTEAKALGSTFVRLYERSGWTHSVYERDNSNTAGRRAACVHLNPCAFPAKFVSGRNEVVVLQYTGSSIYTDGSWRLRRFHAATGADLGFTTLDTPIPLADADPLFDYYTHFQSWQPTGWAVVSGPDSQLGTVNWLVIATHDFSELTLNNGPARIWRTQLWKVDLDGDPTQLELLWEQVPTTVPLPETFEDEPGPWVSILDFEHVPSRSASAPSLLHGCYLDRRAGLYRPFRFDLDTLEMVLDEGPASGAPLVGWKAYEGTVGTTGVMGHRVFFRDCGAGTLWEYADGYRMMGRGVPVSPTSTWEVTPKLAVLENDDDPASSVIVGAAGLTSPIWARPWAADGLPVPSTLGYHNWALRSSVTLRIPVADMRPELVKNCKDVLDFIVQAAGPGWGYDVDPNTGRFWMNRVEDDEAPAKLIDVRAGSPVSVLDEEFLVYGLRRSDSIEEDIQNEVIVTAWEANRPAVDGTLEFAPREENEAPQVSLSAVAAVDGARRVVLNVIRDGHIGPSDYATIGYDASWDTRLLLTWSEDAEDILTELSASATTFSTVQVRGITRGANEFRRLIGGTEVVARHSGFPGDFIQVGDSAFGRVVGFADPAIILTEGLGFPTAVLAAGTSVRIQPARSRTLHQGGSNSGYVYLDGFPGTDTRAFNCDGVHIGNVLELGGELLLVTLVEPDPGAPPPWTHRLYFEREYMDTSRVPHGGGPHAATVYLHPRSALPLQIGATGLTISFAADPETDLAQRLLTQGDRILLQYEGLQARRSPFDRGIAEDPASIATYGRRTDKLARENNPYISVLVAPHTAWAWLQATKEPRVPFQCWMPLAHELPTRAQFELVSPKRLPDQPGNAMRVRLRGVTHDTANKTTTLQLLSDGAPVTGSRPGSAGVGAAVGTGA